MRIGNLQRKALKKLLVNRIEEALFLGEVVDGRSGAFNCYIEGIKAFEKFITIESVRHQRSDDSLNFAGNDIAVDKVRVAKDGSENPFGQEVLNQHLLDSGFGEIGVDRLTTFLMEGSKGGGKFPVRPPFLFDQCCQTLSKRGHSVFEMRHRLLPLGVFLRTMGKEGFESMYQLRRVDQIRVKHAPIVLPEDSPVWGLEEDVVAGVAFLKLA